MKFYHLVGDKNRAEGVGRAMGRSAGRRGVSSKEHADRLTWSGVAQTRCQTAMGVGSGDAVGLCEPPDAFGTLTVGRIGHAINSGLSGSIAIPQGYQCWK